MPEPQLTHQLMIGLTVEGKIIFGLPAPVTEQADKLFLVGMLYQALATAVALPLQKKTGGLLVPDGQPVPDLRKMG